MKFKELSKYIKEIEKVSSRLKITNLLSSLFKKLDIDEIAKTIYLLQGRVAPLYDSREFGLAEKMVIKSAAKALNLDKDLFNNQYKKIGDLGLTVEHFKNQIMSFEAKDLTINNVFENFEKICTSSGKGSQDIKVGILSLLISQLDPLSSRYIVRIPLGTMRLGFSDMTILDSLSWAVRGDKSLRPSLEYAYHVRPNLGEIARIIKEKNIKKLEKINPEVFTPIIMMRAERLSSGDEIIEKIGKCAIEPKYDGFRLQIHIKGKEIKMFSRNLEDVSFMYPDIADGIKKQVILKEGIIEGEAIGFDPSSGSFLPFQETVQRKRKYDIEEKARQVPLKFFIFDLLFINGKNYINESFNKRREILEKIVKMSKDKFKDTVFLASEELVSDGKKIESIFEDAISKGLEGVVAKKLLGVYKPGAREWNWIKFKRSYSSHINDTIDCLVIGYDFGKGKRTGFGIGAFLAGIYEKKNDRFLTVAKIGTGLSDEEWKELEKRCKKIIVKTKPKEYLVNEQTETDVWVRPKLIVEIRADEITKSPIHTAGYALRFPRLERFRDDKTLSDVTTVEEVHKIFLSQKKK
jgi:DNA ligase-1